MFVDQLLTTNSELVEFALEAHRRGVLLPDTYVLDAGAIRENAEKMLKAAGENHVHLYYMLKQLGRNPLIGKMLDELGFDGAVAVDFNEALCYLENGVKLAHVGNLVQIPQALTKRLVAAAPEIVTVYSVEKAQAVDAAAAAAGRVQPVMLRVQDADSPCYPGQNGGFSTEELPQAVERLQKLPHIRIGGVCAFPCFLYSAESASVQPTRGVDAVLRAKAYLESRGFADLQINLPSVTCCGTIPQIAALGGTHGEPGHGLTGTTPLHCAGGQPERVGYLYLTEISHNTAQGACCFGGGYYRRGHLQHALCGGTLSRQTQVNVRPVDADSIDYYFDLEEKRPAGEAVVMCFRTQMFTTRSRIAVADVKRGEVLGIYNALGSRLA